MAATVEIDANVSKFKAAMSSVDASISKTGKGIDGIKNTLEKVFAAQAIFASASRVAEAINATTEALDEQTKAMQRVIAVSKDASATYDQLSAAASSAREQAEKMRKSNEGWGAVKNVLLGIYGLQKDQAESAEALAENLERQAKAAEQVEKNLEKYGEGLFSKALKDAKDFEKFVSGPLTLATKKLSGIGETGQSLFGKGGGGVASQVWRDNPRMLGMYNAAMGAATMPQVQGMQAPSPLDRVLQIQRPNQLAAGTAGTVGMAPGGALGAVGTLGALTPEQIAGISRLASQASGRRGAIGSRAQAAQAQSLSAQAQAAEDIGDTSTARRLRGRAAASEERAQRSIARRQARGFREQALEIGRESAVTPEERESQRTRKAEALSKAKELEEQGRSTRPVKTEASGKTSAEWLKDVYSILDTRLPGGK